MVDWGTGSGPAGSSLEQAGSSRQTANRMSQRFMTIPLLIEYAESYCPPAAKCRQGLPDGSPQFGHLGTMVVLS
jgi:hypothetical protein